MTTHEDTRPRVKYVLADGGIVDVIHDRDEIIRPEILYQLKCGKIVHASLLDQDQRWTRAA